MRIAVKKISSFILHGIKLSGIILCVTSGIGIFIFWITALYVWLGGFGIFIAIMFIPGFLIFPIIFWIVEGVFPTLYFVTWGIGILGFIIIGISVRNE